MTEGASGSARIPLQVSRGCVVASVQVDMRPEVLGRLQEDMLELIRVSGARAVIIDVSGVDTIDPDEFAALLRTTEMARLMGAQPVLSGLNAGVVSSLVDLDVDFGEIEATRTLDGAFARVDEFSAERPPPLPRRVEAVDVEEPDDLDPR
jgi:anti-anti-sigma regulatory factor